MTNSENTENTVAAPISRALASDPTAATTNVTDKATGNTVIRWGEKSTKRPHIDRKALQRLAADLLAVQSEAQFAGRILSGPSVDSEFLMRLIEVYSDWMTRNDAHPTAAKNGLCVSVPAVMARLGHRGVKPTPEVWEAIRALGPKHGFSAFNGRHIPECQIDLDLDEYAKIVRERRKGPPRSAVDPTKPCRIGCAIDIGCKAIDLDATAMKRLRMIMANAEVAGDIYHPTVGDPIGTTNQKRNPAVPALLDRGLAKYENGLPADPLNPDKVDFAMVAHDCRVSVVDILRFSENRARVEAARSGRPLVPHPAIAARSYPYSELMNHGRAARRDDPGNNASPGAASRTSVAALKLFLGSSHAGGDLSSMVPHDFASRVERAIADRPVNAGSGWMAEMRRWIQWNADLRSSKPLPQPFATALRILCLEAGATITDIFKASGGVHAVRQWAYGETFPSLPKKAVLEKIDLRLGVPAGTLANELSEEWRLRRFDASLFEMAEDEGAPAKIAKRRLRHARHLPLEFSEMGDAERKAILEEQHWSIVNQDTDFARRIGVVSRDKYRLDEEFWPEAMRKAWHDMIPKPRKSVLRRPGEVIAPPADAAEHRSNRQRKGKWRDKTIEHRHDLLSSTFGYWTRSRVLSDKYIAKFQSRQIDFTPEAGLGIPVELLHPALFVFPDLMSVFCHWFARRSGLEHPGLANLLALAAEFVRPETGCVWKDPDMFEHIERFKKWWDANPHDTPEGPVTLDIEPFRGAGWRIAVAAAYKTLREDLYRVIRGKLPKSRDPFITVDVFVSHKRPLDLYMKGVRCLLTSRPLVANSKHIHLRRKLMTLILLQTGLRTGTMLMTVEGRNPELRKVVDDDDGTVTWEIRIEAERFKNYDSPFFAEDRAYEFVLEDDHDLYALLDEYIEYSRPYLLAGNKTDALFVSHYGGAMNEDSIRADYNEVTRLFFVRNKLTGTGAVEGAVIHGMHAVRHVIATHIVKMTGDMRLAADAIQDVPRTAERHYARFWPADRLRLVAPILRRARLSGMIKPPA